MAINWEGFIQGVSDYGLERLKEERAMKMKQKLAELEETYKVAAEEREAAQEAKKVKGTRDVAGMPGFVEDINSEGKRVGEVRAIDEHSQKLRQQSDAEHEAKLAESRSTIEHRKAQVAADRERTAAIREGNRTSAAAAAAGSGAIDPATALVQETLAGITKPSVAQLGRLRMLADNAVARSQDPQESRGLRSIYADMLAQEEEFGDITQEPVTRRPIESYKPSAPTPSFLFKLPGTR